MVKNMNNDKRNALAELMERGKASGKLTTKEITDALEELDFDVEQMNKLYDDFEAFNIEIVEDFTPDDDDDVKDDVNFRSNKHISNSIFSRYSCC